MATRKEIKEFMNIFEEEANRELLVGEEVTNYQKDAVREHGQFLADVRLENFRKVARELTNKLKLHNLAFEGRLYTDYPTDKEHKIIEAHLKRTQQYRKTLYQDSKFDHSQWTSDKIFKAICNDNESYKKKKYKYMLLLQQLKEYEDDLVILLDNSNAITTLIPSRQFSKPWSKVKTPLKVYLKNLHKEYDTPKHSKKIKLLIDKLNEPLS